MRLQPHGSARLAMLCAASAGAIAAALGSPAAAQEESEAASASERIVVTGSRISRRDYTANSPIVTVDSEQFESQTSLNVEAYLNQLPQFNPAATPVTTEQDVQVTPVNSVGIATVSLRGLGANRNLVLVDGHRPVPVNALMVTDVNAVPGALIERSEIITGGASAVYGADAVGGVVNFILKDDYEGLEVDSQYGVTEAGDGEQFRLSGVVGANTADGRGNVTLGMEHYSRSASYERNRDWQRAEWANPLLASGDLFVAGVHSYASGGGRGDQPSLNAVNAVFADAETGEAACSILGCAGNFAVTYNFNPDGTLWVNGGALANGTISQFQGEVDGLEYAYQTGLNAFTNQEYTTIKWNDTSTYTAAPQTRYSLFAAGNYDITDSIEWFGRATFSESKTQTRLIPAPAIGGWEVLIPYNPTTDSPVDPTLNYNNPATLAAVLANPSAYANPNFIGTGEDGAQHPVPVELAVLLNSRNATTSVNGVVTADYYCDGSVAPAAPNGCANGAGVATTNSSLWGTTVGNKGPWQPNFIPFEWFDDRSTENTIENWQFETGLRGDLPIKDWTWEAYVSHGEANTYNIANGNFSLERYRQIMQAADYGRDADIAGNQASIRPGFGTDPAQCTSGFYDTLFGGDVAPTEDCVDAIAAVLQSRTQIQQDVAELNIEGGLFELPAGEVRAATGLQYRQVSAQFYPDILQSTSSSLDQVIGLYPAGYMDASTAVQEGYAEALVPLLSDLPFIQHLDLEVGARFSDYDASSEEWTYKILGDWQVNDWLRMRGGYNRATRAPNLGELYLAPQMIFTAQTVFGDPCSVRSSSPFGAGGTSEDPVLTGTDVPALGVYAPGQTDEGAANTRLICEAQMGAATADVYYNQANQAAASTALSFAWIYQQGNQELEAETADTWTFGAVVNSPFENPWLAGLSASVDWYRLDISDAIQQYTVNYARYLCYGQDIPNDRVISAQEAADRAASAACENVPRLGGTTIGFAGGADTILIEYDNQATIETSGVDIGINWVAQFEDLGIPIPGGVGVNAQYTWLDYYRTRESANVFDVPVEWKGTTGPTLSGTNGGAYEYRLFGTLSYFVDAFNTSLRWRHLPEVYAAGYASQKAIFKNNVGVVNGEIDGIVLGFTPSSGFIPTDAYDIFDLSGGWQINDTVSLRAGVNNLFDQDPPASGASPGYPVGTDLTAVCASYGGAGAGGSAGAYGCSNPTSYSLANPGTASAGYYDVNGRSYFIGVKLTY